jgi:hypothetical protein
MSLPAAYAPLSMSMIITELGYTGSLTNISLSGSETGLYGAINTLSTSHPNGISPFAISEWYSYNNSASYAGNWQTGSIDSEFTTYPQKFTVTLNAAAPFDLYLGTSIAGTWTDAVNTPPSGTWTAGLTAAYYTVPSGSTTGGLSSTVIDDATGVALSQATQKITSYYPTGSDINGDYLIITYTYSASNYNMKLYIGP